MNIGNVKKKGCQSGDKILETAGPHRSRWNNILNLEGQKKKKEKKSLRVGQVERWSGCRPCPWAYGLRVPLVGLGRVPRKKKKKSKGRG